MKHARPHPNGASRYLRFFGWIFLVLAGASLVAACSKHSPDLPPVLESKVVEEVKAQDCLNVKQLRALGTHFVRKDVWEKLPGAKTLAETMGGYSLQAIEVAESGDVVGLLGWHEGTNVCVQQRGDEIWAQMEEAGGAPWEGPFVTVNAKEGFDRAYFNRIFGEACYKTTEGESWCFGDGVLRIGPSVFKTKVLLDTNEMPAYGIPVHVDGELAGFWMFVRTGEQWHVFKDEVVTEEGHVDIDPGTFPPWRVLTPVADQK